MSAPLVNGTTAPCHVCGRRTPSALLPLRSGHVGNVCAVCRTCRRGRPFASRTEYTKARDRAEGYSYGGYT